MAGVFLCAGADNESIDVVRVASLLSPSSEAEEWSEGKVRLMVSGGASSPWDVEAGKGTLSVSSSGFYHGLYHGLEIHVRAAEDGGAIVLRRKAYSPHTIYYLVKDGTVAVSTNPLAFLAAGLGPLQVNWQTLWDFLSLLYLPQPASVFEGVFQVKEGTQVEIDMNSGRTVIRHLAEEVEKESHTLEQLESAILETFGRDESASAVTCNAGKYDPLFQSLALLKGWNVRTAEGLTEVSQDEWSRRLSRIYELTGELNAIGEVMQVATALPAATQDVFLSSAGFELVAAFEPFRNGKGGMEEGRHWLALWSPLDYEDKNRLLGPLMKDMGLELEPTMRIVDRYAAASKKRGLWDFFHRELAPAGYGFVVRSAMVLDVPALFPCISGEVLETSHSLPPLARWKRFRRNVLLRRLEDASGVPKEESCCGGDAWGDLERVLLGYLENWFKAALLERKGIVDRETVSRMLKHYEKNRDRRILSALAAATALDVFWNVLQKWV